MVINFGWLIDNKIAGFGQPGGIYYQWERNQNELVVDLEFLFKVGVRALVSLTENPLDENVFEQYAYLHLPIDDMKSPTLNDISLFMDFAEKMEKKNKTLGVHCRAGLGRTGTMLACYLVCKGENPQEALAQVKRKRPGSIETLEQEATVFSYADLIKKQKSDNLIINVN